MKQLPAPPADAKEQLTEALSLVMAPDRLNRIEALTLRLFHAGVTASQLSASNARSDLKKIKSLIALATKFARELEDVPLQAGLAGKKLLATLRSELPTFVAMAEVEEARLADKVAREYGGIFVRDLRGPALGLWHLSSIAAEVYAQASGKRPRRSVKSKRSSKRMTQDDRENSNFVRFLRKVFSALGIDPKKAPRAAKDIISELRGTSVMEPDAWPLGMDQSAKS